MKRQKYPFNEKGELRDFSRPEYETKRYEKGHWQYTEWREAVPVDMSIQFTGWNGSSMNFIDLHTELKVIMRLNEFTDMLKKCQMLKGIVHGRFIPTRSTKEASKYSWKYLGKFGEEDAT